MINLSDNKWMVTWWDIGSPYVSGTEFFASDTDAQSFMASLGKEKETRNAVISRITLQAEKVWTMKI